VDLQVDTNVSKEHNAPIFGTEDGNPMLLRNVGFYLKSTQLYNPEDQHRYL
jgi:hypothetical protein